MTVKEAMNKLEDIGFKRYYYSKVEIDSNLQEGLIVKTSPSVGASFYDGELMTITFYVSNGKDYKGE